MAEERVPEPGSVDDFMAKIQAQNEQLAQRFDSSLSQIAQRQDQLADYVARAQPARTPQPAQIPQGDMDQKLLEEFFRSPTRFVAELGETMRQQSDALVEHKIRTREEQRQAEETRARFWDGWATHNGDVAAFQPMVETIFHQLPANMDPSRRADQATARVRELIAQRKADAVEDQRRVDQQARMTATASGRTSQDQQRPEEERVLPARESQASAIADFESERRKRMNYG